MLEYSLREFKENVLKKKKEEVKNKLQIFKSKNVLLNYITNFSRKYFSYFVSFKHYFIEIVSLRQDPSGFDIPKAAFQKLVVDVQIYYKYYSFHVGTIIIMKILFRYY